MRGDNHLPTDEPNGVIHPTAVVDPKTKIPNSCKIGPFCVVGPEVTLGEGCELLSHVVLSGPLQIGSNNRVFPFTTIGLEPQDLKFKGEVTRVEIGDNNVIRECVTIHRGTPGGGGVTRMGNNCLLMAYVHIAHDCVVGDHVIMANNATLAGHVTVENYATVGAFSPVHQFVRVGAYAYVGGGSVITRDVLPFSRTSAEREAKAYGVNTVGLQRKGFSKERIVDIQRAFRVLINSKLNTTQAVEKLKAAGELGDDIQKLVSFIESSARGVIK
ncbi:MAG TPA: acyl-ACP--UDP-N-acetylglucosamine O-acyltransferase [Terriglobales bacterium]